MKSIKKLFAVFPARAKRKYVILFLGETISSFFNAFSIALLLPFIELLMDENAMDNIVLVKELMLRLGIRTHVQKMYGMGAVLIMVFAIKAVYMVLLAWYRVRVTNREMIRLSGNILREYMEQPYVRHVQQNSSFLLRVLSLENYRVIDAVNVMFQVINGALTTAMLGLYLMFTAPIATPVLIGVLGVISIGWLKIAGIRIKNSNKRLLHFQEKAIQAINQAVGAAKEIKILKCEKIFVQKYIKAESDKAVYVQKTQILTSIPKYCLESLCMMLLILIIFVEMALDIPMNQIVIQMSALALAAVKLLPIISQMNTAMNTYMSYVPSIDVIYSLVKGKAAEEFSEIEGNDDTLDMSETISVQDIVYRYPDTDREVLSGINLSIPSKSSVGLMGESGAGKTTLVDILLGVLQPTEGKILCGAQDLQGKSVEWAKHIGYIPQTIYLLDESIRNNVAFGIPEAEIEDVEVWKALRWAQLDSFVESLPEGLDTEIGERGARLSGGQRQRIGIARALYRQPELLVLDEATSALDNETEKAVMDAIESAMGNMTLVIVAHRLSTLKNCDHIYEVRDGRLLERDDLRGN